MATPYDRARARQDAATQPFKDAREAMNQQEADLHADAEGYGETRLRESGPEAASTDQLEAEMAERLAEVGDEVARERERDPESGGGEDRL
jgi:hypothetical protein